jgi:hypothetical protein
MKGVRLITICLAALLAVAGFTAAAGARGTGAQTQTVSPEVAAAEAAEEAAEVAAEAAEEAAVAASMREFPGWNYRIRHIKHEIARIRSKRRELRELPRTEHRAERIALKTERLHEARAHLIEVRQKFKAKRKEVKEKEK